MMQAHPKPIEFLGDSLDELREFPQEARREAGHQLDRVQHGLEPDDWKPMKTIGAGVKEVRIKDAAGAWPSLKTPCMSCTASRRKPKRHRKQT